MRNQEFWKVIMLKENSVEAKEIIGEKFDDCIKGNAKEVAQKLAEMQMLISSANKKKQISRDGKNEVIIGLEREINDIIIKFQSGRSNLKEVKKRLKILRNELNLNSKMQLIESLTQLKEEINVIKTSDYRGTVDIDDNVIRNLYKLGVLRWLFYEEGADEYQGRQIEKYYYCGFAIYLNGKRADFALYRIYNEHRIMNCFVDADVILDLAKLKLKMNKRNIYLSNKGNIIYFGRIVHNLYCNVDLVNNQHNHIHHYYLRSVNTYPCLFDMDKKEHRACHDKLGQWRHQLGVKIESQYDFEYLVRRIIVQQELMKLYRKCDFL